MSLSITLPWPNKALSPNARVHWAVKARAAKAARLQAWAIVKEALRGQDPKWSGVHLRWVFHPRTRNVPDVDNCISSHKAAQDGIADALWLDDSKFTASYAIAEPVKGGLVRVEIEPRAA